MTIYVRSYLNVLKNNHNFDSLTTVLVTNSFFHMNIVKVNLILYYLILLEGLSSKLEVKVKTTCSSLNSRMVWRWDFGHKPLYAFDFGTTKKASYYYGDNCPYYISTITFFCKQREILLVLLTIISFDLKWSKLILLLKNSCHILKPLN